MIPTSRSLSWWIVVAVCFAAGDVAGFVLWRRYPWLVLGLTLALLLLWGFALVRPTRWIVVLRGNSATNDGEEWELDRLYTRWGARRVARLYNDGPTGTAIVKAEVRRG